MGRSRARVVKEILFLKRVYEDAGETTSSDREDVGRIDMVMAVEEGDRLDWCAVEIQAVYFSGDEFAKDYPEIRAHTGSQVPIPVGRRRPDFRSSGPKRLMPQLQTKVPTLRRWGKKLAIVVDQPFFRALGPMDDVDHVSNCDIAWFVVRFDETNGSGRANLVLDTATGSTVKTSPGSLT